jgi:hypothetical protein
MQMAQPRMSFTTLSEVQSWLDVRVAGCGSAQRCAAESLQLLAAGNVLSNFVRALLRGDHRDLTDLALRSYPHANGYDKILLVDRRPVYALHLHIWPPGGSPKQREHVHDHPWNFSSVLLTGAYQFDLFQLAKAGTLFHRYHCRYAEGVPGHRLQSAGTIMLRRTFGGVLTKGSSYTLTKELLHRIVNVPDTFTSSLMLHGSVQQHETNVFSAVPLATASVHERPFTGDELRTRLERLLSSLVQPSC